MCIHYIIIYVNSVRYTEHAHFWEQSSNQQLLLQQIGQSLNISNLHDWYKIGVNDIVNNGGIELVIYYKGSLLHMLQTIYPHYNWEKDKFVKKDSLNQWGWANLNNQKVYFEKIAKELCIQIIYLCDDDNYNRCAKP
jgi:hypothetical protein